MTISLRAAGEADAYALWLWANDPDSRSASFGREFIGWEAHVNWLRAHLQDPGAVLMIAEAPLARPVGSVRFDTRDEWDTARLSYVVAPEARGEGLSRPIVQMGVERIRTARPSVRIHADVMAINARSLRVFHGLGWTEQGLSASTVRFWSQ